MQVTLRLRVLPMSMPCPRIVGCIVGKGATGHVLSSICLVNAMFHLELLMENLIRDFKRLMLRLSPTSDA